MKESNPSPPPGALKPLPPPAPPRPYGLQARPEPGGLTTWIPAAGPPGRGTCVFTELLTWSKLFYAFHTRTGVIPEASRPELERGLADAIRNAEEFMKD